MTDDPILPVPPSATGEEFFDPQFLAELEGLAAMPGPATGLEDQPLATAISRALGAFLTAAPPSDAPRPLTEAAFVALSGPALVERTNSLVEQCRQGGSADAARAVESFVVFFQALVPTLGENGGREIKRLFFHLVPTLLQVAFAGFAKGPVAAEDGPRALKGLESVLLEISSVRLAPSEADLVFRAIEQMGAFIGVGEYALASEVISSQLLGLIARNKLTRALYRLMEVEVQLQHYLKEKRGYTTPQVRLPEDFVHLADYGPLRLLREDVSGGVARRYIQVHIPDLPMLRDVVLRLAGEDGTTHDLRLDAVGSAELPVRSGVYGLGLVYQPETARS